MSISTKKKKNTSLSKRAMKTTIIGTVLVGLVGLGVGFGIYASNLFEDIVWKDFEIAKTAATLSEDITDPQDAANQTMEIYRSLSDKERAKMGEDSYYAHFDPVTESEEYEMLYSMLHHFRNLYVVNNVYYAVYDKDAGVLIHVADSDTKEKIHYRTGDTEPVHPEGLEKLLNWKEGEGLPYYVDSTEDFVWICTTGTQIGKDRGNLVGLLLVDFTMKDMKHDVIMFLVQYVAMITIAAGVFGIFLNWRLNKQLIRPINEIAHAAQNYVKDRKTGSNETGHFFSLHIETGDEVEHLANVMADMEQELAGYIEDLTNMTAKEARVNTELEMAARIQKGVLPDTIATFPERSEFEICATMEPAKEVGGDFYDSFLVDEDHLCMIMADVSGKGIPAALFMMAAKILLRNHAKMGKSPSEIMHDTNEDICEANEMEMFVTIWLGILEISSGKLIACNAGHEYPVFQHADGAFELLKDKHNFVVGGMPGKEYEQYEVQLRQGDKLFVYTDGVPEALNDAEQVFGLERLCTALNQQADAEPLQVIENVRKAVDDFVQDAEQFDDMTMLCMKYKGMGE